MNKTKQVILMRLLQKYKNAVIPACFKRESIVLLQKIISPIEDFGDNIDFCKSLLMTVIFILFLPVFVLAAGTVDLPKTGQTTCYDSTGGVIACAGTGQDGDVQAGVPWPNPRFTVSTDGYCVTDNLTGLMWVRSPDSVTRKWQQAIDYANGLSLCGYTDWRLSNVNELESLINADHSNSAIWLNTQGFSNVQSYDYWSSTSYAGGPGSAWIVRMSDGFMYDGYSKSFSSVYYVWPVRSGQ